MPIDGAPTHEEFYAQRTIASYFPICFPGAAKWESLKGACAGCHKEIAEGNLRGTVVPVYRKRTAWDRIREGDGDQPSSPLYYAFDALGLCPECDLLTPYHYKLYPDMSLVGISPKTGLLSRWAPRPSIWERFRSGLKRGLSVGIRRDPPVG